MSQDNFEMSANSLKFPYHRFLADAASGLFFLCLCALTYYTEASVFGFEPIRQLVSGKVGSDTKVFLMILGAVSALPAGLIFNGISWFGLGWIQTRGAGFWFKRSGRFMARSTSLAHQRALLDEVFGLDGDNFYRKAKLYEAIVLSSRPAVLSDLLHIHGLKSLLRSGALLLLGAGFGYCGWALPDTWAARLGAAFLVMGAVFLVVLSILEYYHDTAILLRALTAGLDPAALHVEPFTATESDVLGSLTRRRGGTPGSCENVDGRGANDG